MRPTVQLALLLLLSFLATPAGALPALMSDQELMEKSDLVAVVQVLFLTREAPEALSWTLTPWPGANGLRLEIGL